MAAATEEAAVDMVAAVVVAMAAETVVAIAATEEAVADMAAMGTAMPEEECKESCFFLQKNI